MIANDSEAGKMFELLYRAELKTATGTLSQRRFVAYGRAVSRMINLYRDGELYPWYTPS